MADNKNRKYGKGKKKPANIKYLQSRRWESNGAKRVQSHKRREEAHKRHVQNWAWGILGGSLDEMRARSCAECRKMVRERRASK